jgi:hypothetical protein
MEFSLRIVWIRCLTYEAAREYSRVIYLYVWNDKPFYWGKANNSFFGGHKRKKEGLHASGRYNSGYKHWIEGCLRHGASLYIGKLDIAALANIDKVENYLTVTLGGEMNVSYREPIRQLEIEHVGDVPPFITSACG